MDSSELGTSHFTCPGCYFCTDRNEKILPKLTLIASAGRQQPHLRQIRKVFTHILLNANFWFYLLVFRKSPGYWFLLNTLIQSTTEKYTDNVALPYRASFTQSILIIANEVAVTRQKQATVIVCVFWTKFRHLCLSSFWNNTTFAIIDHCFLLLKCCFLLKKRYDVEKGVQKSDESQVDGGQGNLPGTRKIYEFYNAPIVKFWFHTVSHHSRTWIDKPLLWSFKCHLILLLLFLACICNHLVVGVDGKLFEYFSDN